MSQLMERSEVILVASEVWFRTYEPALRALRDMEPDEMPFREELVDCKPLLDSTPRYLYSSGEVGPKSLLVTAVRSAPQLMLAGASELCRNHIQFINSEDPVHAAQEDSLVTPPIQSGSKCSFSMRLDSNGANNHDHDDDHDRQLLPEPTTRSRVCITNRGERPIGIVRRVEAVPAEPEGGNDVVNDGADDPTTPPTTLLFYPWLGDGWGRPPAQAS